MRGLPLFVAVAVSAVVAVLSVLPPAHARWLALALLGVAFVASAIPRRRS